MNVYGQLIRAQLEPRTSDYAASLVGALWYDTALDFVKFSNGTLVKNVLLNDNKVIIGTSGTAATNVRMFRAGTALLQFVPGNDTTAEGSLSSTLAETSFRSENYLTAGKPAPGNAGRIIFVSDALKLQVDTGAAFIDVSGGTGSDNYELFKNTLLQEHYNIFTSPIVNSVGSSFQQSRFAWEARLLEDYSSVATSIKFVVNPLFLEPSDPSLDSAASWTAGGAAINLATTGTAGNFKVGALALIFDKDNSATHAFLSILPVDLGIAFNKNIYGWVKLPSLTAFASIRLRYGADTTFTDSNVWDITTNYAGSPLIVGWNLLLLNADTTPTSTTGAGFDADNNSLAAFSVGVVTTVGAQTYTGIITDGWMFGDSTGLYAGLGDAFTIYDASNRATFTIDSTNVLFQGVITIPVAAGQNFTAANGPTSTKIVRTVPTIGYGFCSPITGLTGNIVTRQEVRLKKYLPANVPAGDFSALVNFDTRKILKITAINPGVSIDVYDPADNSAEFVTGNVLRVVRVLGTDGVEQFVARTETPTLDGNATHASDTTTIPLASTTGLALTDLVFKEQITPRISLVGLTANENFQSMDFVSLIVENAGLQYPNPGFVFGHYLLGGYTLQQATQNLRGVGAALTQTGTVPRNVPFFGGQYASGPFSAVNYFSLSAGDSVDLTTFTGNVSGSFWVYFDSIAATQTLVSCTGPANAGWRLDFFQPATNLILVADGITFVQNLTAIVAGAWYKIAFTLRGAGVAGDLWVEDVLYSGVQGGTTSSSNEFFVGTEFSAGQPFTNGKIADLIVWAGGELTSFDAALMWNNGVFRKVGDYGSYFLKYIKTGLAGQKLTLEGAFLRTTDADDIRMTAFGAIESV